MKTGTLPTTYPELHDPDQYEDFLLGIQETFLARTVKNGMRLFTTDAANLFENFLFALPADVQAHYTCHACRKFVEAYGGLVAIDDEGALIPVMWNPDTDITPKLYRPAVRALEEKVRKAKVTGVFLTTTPVWGQPVTGPWHHMHALPMKEWLFKGTTLKNADQAMAEKLEERGMLLRGLAEFSKDTVAKALPLLEADALTRSEKVLGIAKWLLALHEAREETKREDFRENLTWKAVAEAPPGWCHVRSTMIGTLLSDIAEGLPFATVERNWRLKMDPLAYMRPKAAPTDGQLAQAEKVIKELDAQGSLARRFARIDEVKLLWSPKALPEGKSEGVFGHLKKNAARSTPDPTLEPPAVTITWEKFVRTVLPSALKIDYLVPVTAPFIGLVTAVNPEAPPIIQWDHAEARNPVSWFVYPGNSMAVQWGLVPRQRVEVTGVTLFPHMWNEKVVAEQHSKGAIFLLNGCVDTKDSGNALFPEILKSEFHGIRATIEAYSQKEKLHGRKEASACGIDLRTWNQTFRVTTATSRISYKIDRWD